MLRFPGVCSDCSEYVERTPFVMFAERNKEFFTFAHFYQIYSGSINKMTKTRFTHPFQMEKFRFCLFLMIQVSVVLYEF